MILARQEVGPFDKLRAGETSETGKYSEQQADCSGQHV